ncbi:MAG: hypothetical protein ABSH31_13875 [Bryobacteraceae bacterium]|jgi:hypothetical protein
MFVRLAAISLLGAAFCSADTLTLRSGRVITGQYLGGDARHIRMAVGDRVDTFNVEDVGDLEFSGPSAPLSPTASEPVPVTGIQIPAGTSITIRMIDSVDSNVARLGQTFRASVDEPVLVNGQTTLPRGADALVKLVEDQQSGKFEGKTVLTLALVDLTINGQTIDTTTGAVSQASSSRGARTAGVVGGSTALGAIIGALAGGGRGAAIGAASGAAVGTGTQVLTKGQRVKIPSETRLNFTLQQPIQF